MNVLENTHNYKNLNLGVKCFGFTNVALICHVLYENHRNSDIHCTRTIKSRFKGSQFKVHRNSTLITQMNNILA